MQKTIDQPTTAPPGADGLEAMALRAAAWAGEPLLHEDEDPAVVLAPGTARRLALDEAIAEIEAGRSSPSPEWKIRFALMLGLERVLSEKPPHLASGTELRRHQIDALAGMLTELIAANQRENGNGNGHGANGQAEPVLEEEDDEEEELEGELDEEVEDTAPDPGAVRRYRFRHPTASGKTIAAAGFVEAARSIGVLILTHRRLLVNQFRRELTDEGYGPRLTPEITGKEPLPSTSPITIQTYAWFARHVGDLRRDAYQLVICDEAHTALGEKTSAAIRSMPEPVYIGMTATEQLIAKQVADVFPASVDDLPLQDAARRGLIASLRCLRVPPVAAINSVPIVGGDFDQQELAKVLDHQALNQAAASLYRDRFGDTPGIVYAAGVDHAYNLAQEFRSTGIKATAVSGRTPPVQLAETLAAYERGEINVLINAMLLAEGWNSPRATVVMHLAPTASRRVYQQRIGRIMRIHPRKEAGIVVDFVNKGATHSDRVVTLHSLLDADFYREGARVIPTPRRRMQRRTRRRLTPAPWLVPVTPDVKRRLSVIAREWQRIDPRYLDDEEQRYWATFAGRNLRFEEREAFVAKFTDGRASKTALEQFLFTCAAENPNRRLRMMALADRVSMRVDRASFDDLVTLVTQAPTWEKDRQPGVRTLLKAIGEGRPDAPDQNPRPLDVAARACDPEGARPQGERGIPRGEAAARRAGELARPPARGERRQARRRRARATPAGRGGPARVGRRLHAACNEAARGRARGDRHRPGDRGRARGGSPRAEAATPIEAPTAAEEERRRRGGGRDHRNARRARAAARQR